MKSYYFVTTEGEHLGIQAPNLKIAWNVFRKTVTYPVIVDHVLDFQTKQIVFKRS